MSVLIGAPGAAEWIWQQWHGSEYAAHVPLTRAEQLLERWLGQKAVLGRLSDAVRRELARLEHIPLSELTSLVGGRSRMQLEELAVKRAAELDEIDGYHHFRDAEGYRRDRRKDVRLQELGYLVMRVLATDIDDELEHVVETIERAVFERPRRIG